MLVDQIKPFLKSLAVLPERLAIRKCMIHGLSEQQQPRIESGILQPESGHHSRVYLHIMDTKPACLRAQPKKRFNNKMLC